MIFHAGVLSNKDRDDEKTLGAASAVLYFGGKEWGHTERQYGETVTKHDVDISSLCPALALLKDFSSSFTYEGPILLISAAKSAVPLYLDTRAHPSQVFSLEYTHEINTILTLSRNLSLRLTWSWDDHTLVGFK
jgi:hypothetical protein